MGVQIALTQERDFFDSMPRVRVLRDLAGPRHLVLDVSLIPAAFSV